MPLQPVEGRRGFEVFFQRWLPRHADVDGAAAVVFAVAGRSHPCQRFFDGLTRDQLVANDFCLTTDAAKRRH